MRTTTWRPRSAQPSSSSYQVDSATYSSVGPRHDRSALSQSLLPLKTCGVQARSHSPSDDQALQFRVANPREPDANASLLARLKSQLKGRDPTLWESA